MDIVEEEEKLYLGNIDDWRALEESIHAERQETQYIKRTEYFSPVLLRGCFLGSLR